MNQELKGKLDGHAKWLRGQDGVRADLSEANLRGADLSGADLSEVDLRGANLSGADLSGANLFWANLSEVDLSEANLNGADLREADLSGADLNGTNLRGADLSGADLRGADLCIFQAGIWTAYIQSSHIRIGCKYHSVGQWRNFTDQEISKMSEDSLDCWHKNKPIIMAIAESLNNDDTA